MRVISIGKMKECWERHPDARIPLYEWYVKVCKAQWKSFADIKKDFNSVDSIGSQRYIFNIKGNGYRLVAAIKFTPGLVYIRYIGTHNEYDRIDVRNI